MEKEVRNPTFREMTGLMTKHTLKMVKKLGFKYLTDVQAEVIPKAVNGEDIVATAKTGSGKTLAFLIPLVELIYKCKNEGLQGTLAIIISPTRELALQTFSVLQNLINFSPISSALVIGGESRSKQSFDLSQGMNIVVATPGRLFDHMRTKEFDYKYVKSLVLDEADKIFQYGFEEDLKQIISRLPKNRQTMLFSATRSEATEALIQSAMKENVQSISLTEDDDRATVEGLKQGFVICDTEYRLHWLHKLLKKTQNSKVMVFFSSCKSVMFHYTFLKEYCNMSVMCIHGKMSQTDRTATINEFRAAEKLSLLCTDLAARGLDIPAVDWVVQFDPPSDTNEYIHRVGRTARGPGAGGRAVLLLRPEEKGFLEYLREAKIYLDKYELWDKYSNLQAKLQEATKDQQFKTLATEAFEGYIRALEVKKYKDVFNLLGVDLLPAARAFGLREAPPLDIRVGFSKKHRPRKRAAAMLDSKQVQIKVAKT